MLAQLFFLAFIFNLVIDLYFLIPAVITQIFNPTTKLVIPKGTSNKEAKGEIETQPLKVEAKISKR